MTYSVWQTDVGAWRSLCYRCGFSGWYKHEGHARESQYSQLCTYPKEKDQA